MLGGQLPEAGNFLEAQAGQPGEVIHIDDDTVRVDFNPRLAGRSTLNPTRLRVGSLSLIKSRINRS